MNQACHRLTNIVEGVVKRFDCPPWFNSAILFDIVFEAVFRNFLQSTIGVVNKNDLLSLEESLRDNQGSHYVVGDDATRVADDVGIAVVEPQHLKDVHAAVHACNHREVPLRGQFETLVSKLIDEIFVVFQQPIGTGCEVR